MTEENQTEYTSDKRLILREILRARQRNQEKYRPNERDLKILE